MPCAPPLGAPQLLECRLLARLRQKAVFREDPAALARLPQAMNVIWGAPACRVVEGAAV